MWVLLMYRCDVEEWLVSIVCEFVDCFDVPGVLLEKGLSKSRFVLFLRRRTHD
jgi:hypothetical protein